MLDNSLFFSLLVSSISILSDMFSLQIEEILQMKVIMIAKYYSKYFLLSLLLALVLIILKTIIFRVKQIHLYQ